MKRAFFMLLLGGFLGTAQAQSGDVLNLLFETPPGQRFSSFKGTDEELQALRREHRDANGDGVPDLILERENGGQTLLIVFDMTTRQEIWQLDLTGRDLGLFWGFYRLMVEGEKRTIAVFGDEGMSIFRPDFGVGAGVWVEFEKGNPDYPLLGIVDVNDDGSDDFILGNRQRNAVEVCGAL